MRSDMQRAWLRIAGIKVYRRLNLNWSDPEQRRKYRREMTRRLYWLNHERTLKLRRAARRKNRAKVKRARREYYLLNRDRIRAAVKAYYERNRERVRARVRARRARESQQRRLRTCAANRGMG